MHIKTFRLVNLPYIVKKYLQAVYMEGFNGDFVTVLNSHATILS